ncbi:hypothetical protein [Streptomyces xanthophaeus]|uniref:hypothetical protein n=1 Tax=Streptomyces xanthophaeus TaxID=67385 RepID=UPI00264790F9|nr:hypothetical protein [Streptomyces xanthophaeus]WKD32060.1 hypothetical protein KO717_08930 [Streptomyces xanthophaeus]
MPGPWVNVLLLDAVAETCLAAAAVLRTVPEPSMRQLAADLVSWENDKGLPGRLHVADLRVHGSELTDVPLVPVLAPDGAPPEAGWAPLRGAVLWPDLDLTVLTAHRAHEAGIVVTDPEIGGDRLKRLATLCKALPQPPRSGRRQADRASQRDAPSSRSARTGSTDARQHAAVAAAARRLPLQLVWSTGSRWRKLPAEASGSGGANR